LREGEKKVGEERNEVGERREVIGVGYEGFFGKVGGRARLGEGANEARERD
jgi:hypothetical protein